MKQFERLPANAKGAAFLMLAAFGFSLMALVIKLLGQRLNITQILLLRQLGLIIILAPSIYRGFPGSLKSSRPGLQLARIAFALVAMLCGFTAVIHLPLADATAIFFAKGFFVTIFAVIILGETVGIYRWSAVAIGFIGVIVMLRPGTDNFTVYGLLSLTGAAGAGMVMIIIRLLARTDQPNTIMVYQALGVGIAILVPGIYFWQWPTSTEWMLILALAVVSFIAQKGNVHAYKWGEASVLASLDYVRLLYATLFGLLVFDTFPDAATWIGAGIIVAASIFTIYRETGYGRAGRGRIETSD